MSINDKKNMQERLRFERERLGYTQEEFAKIGGTTRITQGKYEQGSEPKAGYFSAIYNVGADIFYILTGQRLEGEVLSNEEKFLLDKFRQASKEKQTAVLGALLADGDCVADIITNKMTKGKNSQVGNSIGDISNSTTGNITQGNNNEQ